MRLLKANGLLAFDERGATRTTTTRPTSGACRDWSNVTDADPLELPKCDLGTCQGAARRAAAVQVHGPAQRPRVLHERGALLLHPPAQHRAAVHVRHVRVRAVLGAGLRHGLAVRELRLEGSSGNASTPLAANATSAGGDSLLTGTSSSSTTTTTTSSSSRDDHGVVVDRRRRRTMAGLVVDRCSSSAASASSADETPTPRPSASTSPYRAPGRTMRAGDAAR